MLAMGGFLLAALSQLRVQAFARSSVLEQGEKSNRFVVTKIEPAKLIVPMLVRFMSTDRAFLRARREKQVKG